ncbi:ribosomal-processing cysteine protease Prp [Peribacillus kribbensis]|uniref:ribosomal-processing cysteine protease Prp n=1 Tax=Peribacillus kribbensis TaxID=356658 RepID=UPI0004027B1B|nr:ribosomal-processing cysteine protease Prp [Peribacillus kribbensis]
MINVEINHAPDGKIQSFTMSGHAEFADAGQDIVCAGASAVSFGAVNAIEELTGVEPGIEMGGEGGYLKCILPDGLDAGTSDKIQLILSTMLVSLKTIERDYKEYMKIIIHK